MCGEVCGLDLAPVVAPNQGVVFMHTPGFPTIEFWWRVTKLLCEKAGLTFDAGAQPPADPVGEDLSWAVYPEIARRAGVTGSMEFRLSKGSPIVDLEQMIDQSWRLFETNDSQKMGSRKLAPRVIAALRQVIA
jgi:hypothetical protein